MGKIVTKTCRDLVPKSIMFHVINDVKHFINGELWANLYATGDIDSIMEESADVITKRTEMLQLYDACKEAMRVIGDVSKAMVSVSGSSMMSSAMPPRRNPPPVSRPLPSLHGRDPPPPPVR